MDNFQFRLSFVDTFREAQISTEDFTPNETTPQIKQNALEAAKLGNWLYDNLTVLCCEIIVERLTNQEETDESED